MPGVTGILGKANSHFDPIQTGSGPHQLVEAVVGWCRLGCITGDNCVGSSGVSEAGVKFALRLLMSLGSDRLRSRQ